MVEVAERTSDERVQHKNELIAKARATHNGGAIPIAYRDAKLHDLETRVGKTIEKYIEAVAIWGISIDAVFERDMINEFIMLTAGPHQLQFPPMMRGQQVQAIQGSFARERAKLANRLVREGTNRLRELKMKTNRDALAQIRSGMVSRAQESTNTSARHSATESADREEIFILKPTFHGLGINLRALWHRVRRGRARRRRH